MDRENAYTEVKEQRCQDCPRWEDPKPTRLVIIRGAGERMVCQNHDPLNPNFSNGKPKPANLVILGPEGGRYL